MKNWVEHALTHNVEEIVTKEELLKKLQSKKQLRIKIGVDVTSPFIHIGHAVNFWKMREFQKQGHKVVFLIGDFTSLIGDPTGKSKTRPMRTVAEIEKDAKEYIAQATKVLLDDPKVFEVRHNLEWYGKMMVADFFKLCAKITHAKLVHRDMFQKRIKDGEDIYMHELLYPILQGYDSYMLDSDLTVVGNDQLFNELIGRHYQKVLGQEPQAVMTTVITPGLDGKEKQSKSLGNYIAITDSPEDKFGKVMSLPDELIITYYRVYTFIEPKIIDSYEKELKTGANPRDIKLNLASDLVALYHGEKIAKDAKENFLKVFSAKKKPGTVRELKVGSDKINLPELLVKAGVKSKSEARRLVEQGGVKINDEIKKDPAESINISGELMLQIGPRRFFKVVL